jgi:tetratricopeptide (TPR) repeat protein
MPAKKIKRISVSRAAAKKTAKKATQPVKSNGVKQTVKTENKKSNFMIYFYWVVIALFVGTTLYMLSHSKKTDTDNVEISELSANVPTEEPLKITDDSEQYADAGRQKLVAGDTVGALNDFTVAIEKNPTALNYVFRGETLMTGANFSSAINDFDAAIRIDPLLVVAHYDRSIANIKLEKLEEAKVDLDRAINAFGLNPKDSLVSEHNLYAKRAQINLWLRDWTASQEDYTTAIAKTTGDLDWNDYTGRAEARTNLGDYEKAVTDYVSAVTIISDKIQKTPDEKARENISRQAMGFFEKSGALRVKMGQMDLALQDLQAAHTLAIALNDVENKSRLEILISSLRK